MYFMRKLGCLVYQPQSQSVISIYRNIWTSVVAMEKLKTNPFYDKYAAKISKLQVDQISEQVLINSAQTSSNNSNDDQRFSRVSEAAKPSLPKASYAFAPQKKLDNVVKQNLLQDRSADEIKYIWTEHFLHKDAISGIMTTEFFEKMQNRGLQFPMFIFPLPRDQGYEFIVAQFAGNEVHFTPLVNYQAYQENAPECLTIVHYTDLSKEKGIVLMQGEFNKSIINVKEAQFLANELQLYYGGDDTGKLELLNQFHNSPESFKHMDLIKQLETIDLNTFAKKES